VTSWTSEYLLDKLDELEDEELRNELAEEGYGLSAEEERLDKNSNRLQFEIRGNYSLGARDRSLVPRPRNAELHALDPPTCSVR